MIQPTTADLTTRIQTLFGQLRMPLYRYLVVGLGSSEEAEDVTQECFLRLFRYLQQGGSVQNERLWLFHVARNLVLDHNKSGRVVREVFPPDWNLFAATQTDQRPDQQSILLEQERQQMLRRAWQELTEAQREVLRLRQEGLGYREIAELLETNVPVVAAHIRRALAKMKAKIDG